MVIHNISKEIVVQDFGNLHKKLNIDGTATENLIYVGALAMYLPGELRHGHAAHVEDCFYKMPDMHIAAVAHVACRFST